MTDQQFHEIRRGRQLRGAVPKIDMRALDQNDVVRLLRSEVKRAGGQKEWARKSGVAPSMISMVLTGDRPPNEKILSALKLRRVVVYERLDRTAGRPSAPTRRW